ncbi:MAG: SAM-dependent DNA methyltransferase, partial [Mycobacterium sp.]
SGSRWVIDFNDRSRDNATSYRLPYARVVNVVKPERLKNNDAGARDYWWRFLRPRPEMRRAIGGLDEVLAITLVSRTVMPVRVPTDQVFSHAVGVFATNSHAGQSVLSSSAHQTWAIKHGSGMRNDPRYTPSDVFETFPRPRESDRLALIGRTIDAERREIMLRRDLGLTKLYNLVNDPQIPDASDPDVARMRAIHVELDQAVMDAYGWSDIPLDHGFHTYRQMQRWTVSPAARVEILDRLLEENHQRAAEEAKAAKPKGETPRGPNVSEAQATLFA